MAARNLARQRRRSLATGAAVALGVVGMVLLGGYVIRIEHFLRTNSVYLQHAGHVSVYREGGLEHAVSRPGQYAFSAEELEVLEEVLGGMPGVEFSSRYLVGTGVAGNGCRTFPFLGLGLDPAAQKRILEHPEVRAASPEIGRPRRGRLIADAPEVTGAIGVSGGLAKLLGKSRLRDELPDAAQVVIPDCAAGDVADTYSADANVQLAALTSSGSFSAVDAELVNVFPTALAEQEDGSIVAPLALLQELFDTDGATHVAVFLADHRRAGEVARELQARLRARGLAAEAYPYDDERISPYYTGTKSMLGAMVGFIGLIVASVVALSILNAMTLSVLERTREIGTLRALGFTRRRLSALFLRETALLSLCAAVVGIAVALAIAAGINAADIRFSAPGMPGTLRLLVTPTVGLCFALVIALLPVTLAVTWLAVRRAVADEISHLLGSSAA